MKNSYSVQLFVVLDKITHTKKLVILPIELPLLFELVTDSVLSEATRVQFLVVVHHMFFLLFYMRASPG
jgi:hypothetical protein